MVGRSATDLSGEREVIGAMRTLLDGWAFKSLTISEIEATAGVTEGLIYYKYFKDKCDLLLHHVSKEHYGHLLVQIDRDLQGIDGALNKLKKIIWSSIERCANRRVVWPGCLVRGPRTRKDTFVVRATTYWSGGATASLLTSLTKASTMRKIRDSLPPAYICNTIFGAIGHLYLSRAIFNELVSINEAARTITDLFFFVGSNTVQTSSPSA